MSIHDLPARTIVGVPFHDASHISNDIGRALIYFGPFVAQNRLDETLYRLEA